MFSPTNKEGPSSASSGTHDLISPVNKTKGAMTIEGTRVRVPKSESKREDDYRLRRQIKL